MKALSLLCSICFPVILSAASPMNWQWVASGEDFACSYKFVRTAAPQGMESPEYSVLVVYSWEFEGACKDGVSTAEHAQVEQWSSKLYNKLVETKVGFSVATIVEPQAIKEYYYVSDLNAFRTLSLTAGEVMIDAKVDYRFMRDLDWTVWQELLEENQQPIEIVGKGK